MNSEVYNQSTCLMSEIAYAYYIEGEKRTAIAEKFGLSPATISRVLKRAKTEGIIEIHLKEPYLECNRLEKQLEEKFHLMNVCIVPLDKPEEELHPENVKKQVALEAARYLQRIIREDDIIGMAWGGTMYHMIQYLNPCRKMHARVVTLHGSIASCSEKLEVKNLVNRAAMAFGGKHESLEYPGLLPSVEEVNRIRETKECREIFKLYKKIDIAITGIGSLYPDYDSLLMRTDYLNEEETQLLKDRSVYSDLMLRFLDKDGKECESTLKDRTLSIDLDTYRKIPCKIQAASGSKKADSVLAALKGNLVDVLIVDYYLAKELIGR